jgi:uncharacterized protein YqeY
MIRATFLAARKDREADVSAFLGTIIGEIESKAVMVDGVKTVTEDQTIAVLKQFEKRNLEFIKAVEPNVPANIDRERFILGRFLPQQLSESEIRAIFETLEETDMGSRMKHLKENYSGQYDGKVASRVAKE